MREFARHYVRGLGMSTHNNTLAYGYSVAITTSFALLAHEDGPVSILKLAMFIGGAGLGFAVVNALVTRGYRERAGEEPPVVAALATSFSIVSISAGAAVAGLLGWGVGGWAGWLLGALLATWAYLSVAAVEFALARTLHLTVGGSDPERR